MNIPIPPDDLDFARHHAGEDVERALELVPALALRVQALATELLRQAVILVSIRVTGQSPTPDTPFELWAALQGNPQAITEQEATQFDALSSEAGGWVIIREEEVDFIEMGEWLSQFRTWSAGR